MVKMRQLRSREKIDFSRIDPDHNVLWPEEKTNWNFSRLSGDTYSNYLESYLKYYLPLCLGELRKQDPNYKHIKVFDFGCGFGPMAYATYLLSNAVETPVEYLGLDIRKDAIEWLSTRYKNVNSHSFIHNDVPAEYDYISAGQLGRPTFSTSEKGVEGQFSTGSPHNIQWSSSVFTHMTSQGALNALESIAASASQKSVQINSWLIVDDISLLGMHIGTADRRLPIDMGDFLTNNASSPLECTAFKQNTIFDLYQRAGLEIIDIEYGGWRNKSNPNTKTHHYQDLIISRKMI